MTNILEINGVQISVAGKQVIDGIDLSLKKGETVVIMGPNGSGKSTLAHGLMGHPGFEVSGEIRLEDQDVLSMKPDERSRNGMFLSFQYPIEISGVTVSNFLRTALNARREKNNQLKMLEFMKLLYEKMELLGIPKEFASRYVNEGFSGGEKKKMEILQLAMLAPKLAILDETDSGLDIDALKIVCESLNKIKKQNPAITLLIITHYQRMLNYITPDKVCILLDGKITRCGGPELAKELEEQGYA